MKQSFAAIESFFFYSLILFLPTQLGKHFWPDFASVLGIRVDYLSPTIYFTDALILLLFILWLCRSLKEKSVKNSKLKTQNSKLQVKRKKNSSSLVYIFTILFLIFNILISGRILGGLYSLLKLLEMSFLAYYTAKFITQKSQLQKIILLFSISTIFESLLAICQFVKQGSIGGLLYFFGERTFDGSTPGIANASLNGELVLRPYATFPHPNVLAGYLVVVMTLIPFSLHRRKPNKVLSIKYQVSGFARQITSLLILNSSFVIQITALILGSIALILSMGRVAIVVWFFIVCYYFLRKAKKRFVLFVLGLAALFILSPFGARFTGFSLSDESVVQRSSLIDSSLKMIEKRPLVGVGLGNFIPVLSTIQKPLSLGLYLQPVHNIFFLVTAETGLIGLGFFLWLLWKTFQRIKNQEVRIKETLFIVFFTILVTGLFDHYWLTLQQGQLLFALVIGLCWARTEVWN